VIARQWKGIAKPGQAEAYLHHLKTDTFPKLSAIPGFIRASILSRSVQTGTEFQIVTIWDSLDAIRAFAGSNFDVAVVPPVVQELMASYDSQVAHYDLREQYEPR